MNVTIRFPMPRLAAVEARDGLNVCVTWKLGRRAPRMEIVDLSSLIETHKFYKPLRNNAELFRTVHIILDGSAIAWGKEDEIDMAATSIERLAEESMTADDFRLFLAANKLTHAKVATELGYERRQIEYFLSGRPIPRVVVLACYGYVARKQTTGLSALLYDGTQVFEPRAITTTRKPETIRTFKTAVA